MPIHFDLERAVQNIQQLKKLSLVFTRSELINLCLRKHGNPKTYYRAVQRLIERKHLKHVYRIYSPDKINQYVDYTSRDDIPFGSYAYYEPTGEEFYVNKQALPEVFYQFI